MSSNPTVPIIIVRPLWRRPSKNVVGDYNMPSTERHAEMAPYSIPKIL